MDSPLNYVERAWRLESYQQIIDELYTHNTVPSQKVKRIPTNQRSFYKRFAQRPLVQGVRLSLRAVWTVRSLFWRFPLMVFLFILFAAIFDVVLSLGEELEAVSFALGFAVAVLVVFAPLVWASWRLWKVYRLPQQVLVHDFRLNVLPYIRAYNKQRKLPLSDEFKEAAHQLAYAQLWYQSRNPLVQGRYQVTGELGRPPLPFDDPRSVYSPHFLTTVKNGQKVTIRDLVKPKYSKMFGFPKFTLINPMSLLYVLGLAGTVAYFSRVTWKDRPFSAAVLLVLLFVGVLLLQWGTQLIQSYQKWVRATLHCENYIGTVTRGAFEQAYRAELLPWVEAYAQGRETFRAVEEAYWRFLSRYPLTMT